MSGKDTPATKCDFEHCIGTRSRKRVLTSDLPNGPRPPYPELFAELFAELQPARPVTGDIEL
jgi:hypothetical protein